MVLGAVLIAVVLVVVLPVAWWVAYGAVAFALGRLLTDHAEATHAGSDLIDTNV